MSASNYEKVLQFTKKFDLPTEPRAQFPNDKDMHFRILRQEEECRELLEAWQGDDLVKSFDALLDAAYIVYGTAIRMGITPAMWDAGFAAVHEANMNKVRAAKPEDSKYGTTVDIVKPAGWTGPEEMLAMLLGK